MSNLVGKKCLVGCNRSGIFYGEVVKATKDETIVKNCRKIFFWTGAACIEQLAEEGTTRPNDCKFTMSVDEVVLFDATQIIPCKDMAINNIEEVSEWKIR